MPFYYLHFLFDTFSLISITDTYTLAWRWPIIRETNLHLEGARAACHVCSTQARIPSIPNSCHDHLDWDFWETQWNIRTRQVPTAYLSTAHTGGGSHDVCPWRLQIVCHTFGLVRRCRLRAFSLFYSSFTIHYQCYGLPKVLYSGRRLSLSGRQTMFVNFHRVIIQ